MSPQKRIIHIEGLRGIAALIVVVHHFLLAFSPETSGYLAEHRTNNSWAGSALFGFINGTAAVSFFFVLSGYVLTYNYMQTGNRELIYTGIVKRLPRLFLPVFISSLLSYALFKLQLYYFTDASILTNSKWLASLGFGKIPSSFEPNLMKVLLESIAVFFNGVNHYNPVLWTMHPEFYGSLLTMVLAYCIKNLFNFKYTLYLCSIFFLISTRLDEYLPSFLIGLYIGISQVKWPDAKLNRFTSLLITLSGLYLLGYVAPIDSYQWLASSASNEHFPKHLHAIGSALIMISAIFHRNSFSMLRGKLGEFLGNISFPIYLIHMPVIGSISCYVFLQLYTTNNQIALMAIVFSLTITASMALAYLLFKVDVKWVNFINSKMRNQHTVN